MNLYNNPTWKQIRRNVAYTQKYIDSNPFGKIIEVTPEEFNKLRKEFMEKEITHSRILFTDIPIPYIHSLKEIMDYHLIKYNISAIIGSIAYRIIKGDVNES